MENVHLPVSESVNAFSQIQPPHSKLNTLTYQFNSDDLGKAHNTDNKPYRATVKHTNNQLRLSLVDNNSTELRNCNIKYGDDSSLNFDEAIDHAESILWSWAVYLRESNHHPARDALESLGRVDIYPPLEKANPAIHASDWHYKTSVDYISPNSGYYSSSHTGGMKTRIEFQRTAENRHWYWGNVCTSFYHKSPEKDAIDPQYVYQTSVYIDYSYLKPVDERDGKYDSKEQNRLNIISDDRNKKRSVKSLVDNVRAAMDKCIEVSEIHDCKRQQEIKKEAKRRWDPQTETYRDQTGITSW